MESGVQEILVVSQDTSAYGKDKGGRTDFGTVCQSNKNITSLARQLGKMGAWVRLRTSIHTHGLIVDPLMAEGLILPYLDIQCSMQAHVS